MDITELVEISKRLGGFEPIVTELRVSKLVYVWLKASESGHAVTFEQHHAYFGIPIYIDENYPPGYWAAKGRDGKILMSGNINE